VKFFIHFAISSSCILWQLKLEKQYVMNPMNNKLLAGWPMITDVQSHIIKIKNAHLASTNISTRLLSSKQWIKNIGIFYNVT
jgi:hypothetical protein